MLRLIFLLVPMLSLARAGQECQGDGCSVKVNSLLQSYSAAQIEVQSSRRRQCNEKWRHPSTGKTCASVSCLYDYYGEYDSCSKCGRCKSSLAEIDAQPAATKDETRLSHVLIANSTPQRLNDAFTDLINAKVDHFCEEIQTKANKFIGESEGGFDAFVVEESSKFVNDLCTSETVRGQATEILKEFSEGFCVQIGNIWLDRSSAAIGAANSAMESLTEILQSLMSGLRDTLNSVSAGAARILTNILNFLFTPAKLIPKLGDMVYSMLVSIGEVITTELETGLNNYFENTVVQIFHQFYEAANDAYQQAGAAVDAWGEENADLMTILQTVFDCAVDVQDQADFSSTIDGLLEPQPKIEYTPSPRRRAPLDGSLQGKR